MATEETQRGAAEKPADIPESQLRLLWGLVGVLITVLLWSRFLRVLEPDWLSEGLGLGLFLGAYLGMASWRGRREHLGRSAAIFAIAFIAVVALHAVRAHFAG
jgi:hypothetical protein